MRVCRCGVDQAAASRAAMSVECVVRSDAMEAFPPPLMGQMSEVQSVQWPEPPAAPAARL
jgi:hypothetical protein